MQSSNTSPQEARSDSEHAPSAGADQIDDSLLCYNCSRQLASEEAFCPSCGQKKQQLRITLTQLTVQWWAATLDIDNKFWRTLWTLFRFPGKLTEEFVRGRRVRYLRPITLCLLATGTFFLALEWTAATTPPIDQMQADGSGVIQIDILPGFRVALPEEYFSQSDAPVEERIAIIEEFTGQELDESQQYWLPRILSYVSDDGVNRLQGRLIQIGSRVAFALIPLFALAVFILHFRQSTYVESVLYALHIHSWAFLLAAIGCVLPEIARPVFAVVLAIATVWYVQRSLRVAFNNRLWSALWKTMVLLLAEMIFTFAAIAGVVFFILVVFGKSS